MILRDELESFLRQIYKYEDYEDYCENGLVVEGSSEINSIAFGVSFNGLFIDEAIGLGSDAVIVHHGIFDKGNFVLKGIKKERIKKVINNEISLFGIHLPMDAHPEIGHNALLLDAIGAKITGPLKWGFFGENSSRKNINEMMKIFNRYLDPQLEDKGPYTFKQFDSSGEVESEGNHRFEVLKNGPDIPVRIFIASGGSTDLYEEAVKLGADTFICGEIKEHIPAISHETKTNFINLGHYYSEKPGILALKSRIEEKFDVNCTFIEVPNMI
ncbi:MAG: Nif3-like dinuclear metal center hexameric protein [Acidobacteriota bacterium]